MPTTLNDYTLDPDIAIASQFTGGGVWPGYVAGTSTMVQPIATAFAQVSGGRMGGDSNHYALNARSDGYAPNSTSVLRIACRNSPIPGSYNKETDDTEGWYAWSFRWPMNFFSWEGMVAFSPYHVTHPSYAHLGFRCPQAGQYGIEMGTGHCPSPAGSGTSDAQGSPGGPSGFSPIGSGSSVNTSNKNGYYALEVLLGPGGARPLTLNKWHDFIAHIIFKAQTNGTMEVWHREEGAASFAKLYSNLNDASAVINRTPHPTLMWNLAYGNASCDINFQIYRPPGFPTIQVDWAGYRRRSSYAIAEALFPGSSSLVPVITTSPAVTGTPGVGNLLTTDDGVWENTPTSYTYQWKRDTGGDGNFATIGGATANTYTQQAADDGDRLVCDVTASNASGAGSAARSNIISLLPSQVPAVSSGSSPGVVTPTTRPGAALAVDVGTWDYTPTSYTYQWRLFSGGTWADISGATSATYTRQAGDIGKPILCRVVATNAVGSSAAIDSESYVVRGRVSGGRNAQDGTHYHVAGVGGGL